MTKTFLLCFCKQEEVYQSAMSLMELETDVYLSGSEEEKYASATKVSNLASELLDSEKAAGTIEVGMNYNTIKQDLYNSFYSMFRWNFVPWNFPWTAVPDGGGHDHLLQAGFRGL